MVSFTPTEEQQQLIDTIRRYSTNDVQPIAHEADEHGSIPERVLQMGWEIGLIPSSIPEEMGGFGELSAITGVRRPPRAASWARIRRVASKPSPPGISQSINTAS